jgi:hypothetical protein
MLSDAHDVEKVALAIIKSAHRDVGHRGSAPGCGGNERRCARGGHVCETCGEPIWVCAERFLNNLRDALRGDPGAMGAWDDARDLWAAEDDDDA